MVTTSIGAEGMGLEDGSEALIADDANKFAADVIKLYTDEALWQRLSDRGYEHIGRHFTPEIIEERIRVAVNTLVDAASAG